MCKFLGFLPLAACLLCPTALLADFQYQETTQITGGSIVGLMKMAGAFSSQARQANQPITSTVMLKGNRMVRMRPDSTEIIDLDRGTVTEIDTAKRQYTTMTFEQMRQRLEQAQRDAEKKQASARQQAPAPDEADKDAAKNVDLSYQVHVENTGATKQVSGLDTNEAIMTMQMVAQDKTSQQKGALGITNDMWMAPDIPGFAEVRAFDEKLAKRMGYVVSGTRSPGLSALMAQPGAAKSLENMAAEMQKLKGVPVLQVMRMGSTADGKPLPAASQAPLPETATPQMPSAGDIAQQTATSAIASKLGSMGGLGAGFGGFGRKKKAEAPPPDDSAKAQADAAATTSVLIESSTTMSGFSSAPVDPAHFDIPAGYKEVAPKMEEASR